MKGSQGEERESFRVRIWAFTKKDKGGWETQEQVGVAKAFVKEAEYQKEENNLKFTLKFTSIYRETKT